VIGRTLAHYRITAPLGAGGMGEVYRASDEKLGREVAIKVLPADVAGDADRLARLEREARAVAALSHPNILSVHELGCHEGTAYLVTELLEGETLRERLSGGPLPLRKVTEYAAQVARGLPPHAVQLPTPDSSAGASVRMRSTTTSARLVERVGGSRARRAPRRPAASKRDTAGSRPAHRTTSSK
jgi:serine/threonine protein kinase